MNRIERECGSAEHKCVNACASPTSITHHRKNSASACLPCGVRWARTIFQGTIAARSTRMDFQLARVLESQQRDFRRRIWHACARECWPQAGIGARAALRHAMLDAGTFSVGLARKPVPARRHVSQRSHAPPPQARAKTGCSSSLTPQCARVSRHTEHLSHALPLFAAPAGAQAHYIVTGWRAKGKIMAKP